jgi:hypothetical protein
MIQTAKEGWHYYTGLDPRTHPSSDTLLSIYREIQTISTGSPAKRLLAALALELAQTPTYDAGIRDQFRADVFSRYLATRGGLFKLSGTAMDLIRAHLPFLRDNEAGATNRPEVLERSTRLMGLCLDRQFHRTEVDLRDLHKAHQLGASMLLNTVDGVAAHTSLARHKTNSLRLDNKKYSWNISAESDGTTLPRGTYRLQIKTPWQDNPCKDADYHPDLHAIDTTDLYGDKLDVYRLANPIDSMAYDDLKVIDAARDQLLHKLDQKPPATEELIYLK